MLCKWREGERKATEFAWVHPVKSQIRSKIRCNEI